MAQTPGVCDKLRGVYVLFLDESDQPGEPTFAIGGIAVRVDEWAAMRDCWEGALSASGWPLDKEAKWHGIKTGEVPPQVADNIFATLSEAPITCFVVILRPIAGRREEATKHFFESDEDTYATGLTFIAERFQRFLSVEESYGVIVLDSRRDEMDDRLRRTFKELQREGTDYRQLDRIVDSLLLGPSHHSVGLQVADLVVASTLAGTRQLGDASRWLRQMKPRFARHRVSGEIKGVGLKVYPPQVKGDEDAPPDKLF